MKSYFAYIRVSTTRQGVEGVSLQEQRAAILEYANRRGILIAEWFEEQKTAAKRGRPVFSKMVSMLKAKRAGGVIIHKIDRGARNLRDWADIADLMDRGIEVHFAHESIDLHSRSGRLFLVGETKKRHVYYRCHRRLCPTTCIRLERFQEAILTKMGY